MPDPAPIAPRFASAESVIARASAALRPPKRLKLSEWADQHFYLSAESAAEPGRWKTLPYQRGIMDAITDPRVGQVTVLKSARVGYALALDTPLPTPTGWTTMGEVAAGAELLDDSGRPCRVVTKSPIFRDHDCYRVQFCDGSEIVADAGHRWLVESDVALEHLTAGRRGRTGRPKPGETATFCGVIDTATVARAIRTSGGRNALAIRNAGALDLPSADLPIPPYTLGLWLGDGHLVTPRITQHRPDVETAGYIAEEGIPTSVRYIDARYPNNATVFLDVPESGRPVSRWAARFRALGLLKRKFIPSAYLRASRAQRLALLRGLMDSDGTIGMDGRAEFVNTAERLALGVYELVVSLGMKASIHHRPPQRPGYLPQWRVNFKALPSANPFRLRRKAARVLEVEKPSITMRRRVVAVERVEPVAVQCVEVDSPSHLFLAGWQMVPTHNTKILDAAVGYYMHQDPCPIMIVQPTVEDAEGYSKEELAPMLRDCPALSAIMPDAGPRDGKNTILHKLYPGGSLSVVGANSGRGFRRVSRKVIALDEVDGYPPSAGGEGDQVKLAIRRGEYYWDRKVIIGSTPLTAGASRIAELFEAGDQRHYYVPCPTCGHMDFLTFREGERGHWMAWDEGKPETAHFICRGCGCEIEHKDKRAIVERGEWRADAPFTGHASFHVWAAYSYSPNATWAQLAAEFLDAKKGGPEKLKTFVNTTLGETWHERGEAPDWQRLYERRESYPIGTVPAGVVLLTAGVDVQRDRLVWEVVGWGVDRQSWSVDAGVIMGDTSGPKPWADLDEMIVRAWPRAGGADLGLGMVGVDSGFNTQTVYGWARRHGMSKVIACKGSATAKTLIGSPSPVDLTFNGKRIARGYKVWPIGVDIAKAELYGWLRLPMPNKEAGEEFPPGYCHFPEHGEDYFKQITAEHLVSTVGRRGFTTYEWQVQPGRENHWLDCRVYARAAAMRAGLDRLAARKAIPPPAAAVQAAAAVLAKPAPAPAPSVAEATPARKAPAARGSWLGGGRGATVGGNGWLSKRR